MLAKGEKETAALVARMHAKWAATPYLKLYQTAIQRTLDDPTFAARAVQELDGPPQPNPPSSSPPASRPVSAQQDSVDKFFNTWTMPFVIALILGGLGWGWYLQKIGWKSDKEPYFKVPSQQQADLTPYGSADWEPPIAFPPDQMTIFSGVFLGKSSEPGGAHLAAFDQHQGGPVFSEPQHHSIIVAKTRTGKSTRIIVPTLLRQLLSSCIVVDPKAELAAVTARARMNPFPGKPGFGHKVHIINPWGELAPTFQKLGLPFATYNPLDVLDRNDPNVVSVAQDLAAAICPKEKGGKDAFWSQSAASILTAVLLWLTDQPGETKTLARTREIVTSMNLRKEFLPQMAASSAFGGAIAENAGPFVYMAQETFSGIVGNLAKDTAFLSDPQVKAATATSSFSMMELLTKLVTVYLVVPSDRIEMQRTWLRLVISAGLQTYKHHATGKSNRCLFIIDELSAVAPPDLVRDVAILAGHAVDLLLSIQNIQQLEDAYGPAGANTILSNCSYQWFCNINHLDTAQRLSKVLGNQTVQTKGQSTNVNFSQGGGSSGSSTTVGQTGRPLLMPDEILTLGRDTAILLAPGKKPQYLRPIDYWKLAEAFPHLREYYAHMYLDPPLWWDDNPLPH